MKTEYTISKERHDEICKLELEAIKERDLLRADNDHLRQENERLKGEVEAMRELHIMQLAGISTASIQNTESTVKDRITDSSPYWTCAYMDVCRAVDREMKHRNDLATYKAAVVESREALELLVFGADNASAIEKYQWFQKGKSALHTLSALTGDATKTT